MRRKAGLVCYRQAILAAKISLHTFDTHIPDHFSASACNYNILFCFVRVSFFLIQNFSSLYGVDKYLPVLGAGCWVLRYKCYSSTIALLVPGARVEFPAHSNAWETKKNGRKKNKSKPRRKLSLLKICFSAQHQDSIFPFRNLRILIAEVWRANPRDVVHTIVHNTSCIPIDICLGFFRKFAPRLLSSTRYCSAACCCCSCLILAVLTLARVIVREVEIDPWCQNETVSGLFVCMRTIINNTTNRSSAVFFLLCYYFEVLPIYF